MQRRTFMAAIAGFLSAPRILSARPLPDALVLRITSPRGDGIKVSGTIQLKSETRRVDAVSTPYEVRLPGGEMEAKFHADDNGSVGGELSVYKDGQNTGRVTGQKRDGEAFFFVKPTGRFGFGQATR